MHTWFARPLTIRAALLAGFGLTLGLWLFAGYQVTLRIREAQGEAAAVGTRYLHAQDLLAAIRSQVLVSSVLVRDALLNPDPASASADRAEIERAYDAIDDQLNRYVPFVGSPAERERVGRLGSEAHQLRSASEEVLTADRTQAGDARLLLQRFMPQREAAVGVSEEVQSLNRAAFVEQQRAITGSQASLQRQILTVFGVALAISVSIGWLAFHHTTRLERHLTQQRAREERIALDLQRLSARLVHIQEEERSRIARELHDAVGQALSAVKVELLVAERTLERLAPGANLLQDAQVNADSALRSVRDLSHLLHPSALDDLGLVAALGSHLAEYSKRHEIAVAFLHAGIVGRQPAEVERAVYRIVQEALTNVARHAHARRVRVALAVESDVLRVVVEDDGRGFDVSDAEQPGRRRGLGLLGIRERALQLGGTVCVSSRFGDGTQIQVDLPTRSRPGSIGDASEPIVGSALTLTTTEVSHG